MTNAESHQWPCLHDITNGKCLQPEVNIAESANTCEKMDAEYRESLPTGFHAAISTPIKEIKDGIPVPWAATSDQASWPTGYRGCKAMWLQHRGEGLWH